MQLKPLTADTEIRVVKQRFATLNRERLLRVQEALRWKQRDFLELLPLLFHMNHPMLPGYISKDTPSGISDYLPSQKSLEAAKRISKAFEFKKRALRTHDIHAIFLMGSSGTVAYSEKSDFDLWLCHRPTLNRSQIEELNQKALAIEQWTATLGLEVHFFLMNAEQFKSGEVVNLSSESSGTAQHHLLLEEFYRTGLLIAGRYPAWWLVPPDKEADYDNYINQLITRRFINVNEIIDFGGLSTIPPQEFFGAALWQVYKGIDSPYKSVLKIILMETYAQEFPHVDLLCARFKKAIYSGEISLDRIDPYVMLIEKLEQYLTQRAEKDRLELVQRCFYFKVNLPLSTPAQAKHITWQRELMQNLVESWGWNSTLLSILDSRNSWKINRVLKERKILVDELTNSYLFLSDFARRTARLTHISQRDLTVLGRKLYASFERKAGKVEIVNRGIAPDLIETHLALQEITGSDGQDTWTLSHGAELSLTPNKSDAILKRGTRPLGLIAWLHFNKLMSSQTVLTVRAQHSELDVKEFRAITACLEQAYPKGELPDVSMEALSRPPVILSAIIFVNIGIDPMARGNRQGADIISNRTDVLNYSGFAMNLALSFDQLLITSWQEVLHFGFQQVHGLMDCLCQYLQLGQSDEARQVPPPQIRAYSFSSTHGPSIAKRIEELFADTLAAFYGEVAYADARYILQCEQYYFVVYRDNNNFVFARKENYGELMRYLAEPRVRYTTTHIDRNALIDTVLPTVLNANRPGAIQFFYQTQGKSVDIFVTDEHGSLFSHRMPYYDEVTLINHFDQFFESTTQRINFSTKNDRPAQDDLRVVFYEIVRGRGGSFDLKVRESTREFAPRRYFNVQVISSPNDPNNAFTVFCDEKEFASFEYGAELFREVAKFVISQRRSGLRYPIFITDIDLPPSAISEKSPNPWQTVNFLNYKKRIEERLNQELEKL